MVNVENLAGPSPKDIQNVVFNAASELNEEMPDGEKILLDLDAPIFGDGAVDSLRFVRFVLLVEENISSAFGTDITIIDETVFTEGESPLESIGSLIEFLRKKLSS